MTNLIETFKHNRALLLEQLGSLWKRSVEVLEGHGVYGEYEGAELILPPSLSGANLGNIDENIMKHLNATSTFSTFGT